MIVARLKQASTQTALFRLLAIMVVLALSFFLGRRPSPLWLVLVVGAVLAIVLLRRPELGFVAVLVSAMLVPFSIGTGTGTRLHAAILLIPLLAVLWLADMVLHKNIRLTPSPTNLPLLAFALSATISFLAGNMPWNYFADKAPMMAQIGGWAIFVLSAAIFLLVGNQIKDVRWLKALVVLFLGIAAVVLLGRVVPPVAAVSNRLVQAGAQGSIFWIWLVALAAGQALFNQTLLPSRRAALGGLALLSISILYLQGRDWASGWAPPLVALLVLLWLRSWRVGLVVAVAALLAAVAIDRTLPATLVSENEYSIITRQAAWQVILGQVITANPIIGLGPANYYHHTPLYSLMGYYIKVNSHNQYVDIVAQTGLVGAAAFAWLVATIGLLGWRLRQRVTDGFARGYVCACLAGLAGSLVAGWLGDWFLPFVYNIGLAGMRASLLGWMFLGGLVSIKRLADTGSGV